MALTMKHLLNLLKEQLQKINQTEFRVGRVMTRKHDRLYVKRKGYNNSFNISIDKKDILYKYCI